MIEMMVSVMMIALVCGVVYAIYMVMWGVDDEYR